jgi:hypothetical protein
MSKMHKVRSRRVRRQFKAAVKFGALAKPRHNRLGGRTGKSRPGGGRRK